MRFSKTLYISYFSHCETKYPTEGDTEMVQLLRALVALAEDLCLILRTYMVVHNRL